MTGSYRADIPKGTSYATGTLGEEVFVFELGVGDLDPAQEERGSADRLNNMSNVAGEYTDAEDEESCVELASVLEFFQDDSGDVADGQLTEVWKQRLESEHGC